MDITLKKVVELGLRAWLNGDFKLADSVAHTIEKGGLLTRPQLEVFRGLSEDFAMTGRLRKTKKFKGPIDEAALADDVNEVLNAT